MQFKDGIVILQGEDPVIVYKDIRRAFMDGELPVHKVIGFKIVNPRRLSNINKRESAIAESVFDIATNLSKLTFVGIKDNVCTIATNELSNIPMDTGSLELTLNGRRIEPIDNQVYICTPVSEVSLRLVVASNIGEVTMDTNCDLLKYNIDNHEAYFPIQTYHSLVNYVTILPWFGKGDIRYKLNSSTSTLTDDILNSIWKEWKLANAKGKY